MMEIKLTAVEARVLGVLIEKELTTPEYYPLSLNALVNGCNQKSSRDPVMNLNEKEVMAAIETLKDKKLVWQLSTVYGRVPKYEHNIQNVFPFSKQETAIIDVLFLRGASTLGELRVRTERMYRFSSLGEIKETLDGLARREDGPFVMELPRRPGHKDNRYLHLFCDIPDQEQQKTTAEIPEYTENGAPDRISALEHEVRLLRVELDELKQIVMELKKQ